MAYITSLSIALSKPRVCQLRQPATSPTIVATSTDKMEKLWVLQGGRLQTSPVEDCWWTSLRATSNTSLKARDHCNLRALIGWKGRDCPSSLHIGRWKPKGPKKTSWMKSLHGALHGGICTRLHGLPEFSLSPPPRGGVTKIPGDIDFFDIFSSMTNSKIDSMIYSRTDKTPPNNFPNLIEFETYYIRPYPPPFFLQTKYAMVPQHGSFSLMRACDHIKRLSQHPWYGLWMRVTITRSRLLAHVWSEPKSHIWWTRLDVTHNTTGSWSGSTSAAVGRLTGMPSFTPCLGLDVMC